MEQLSRKPYPSGVIDDEWAFVSVYQVLMDEQSPQRHHDLREVFNALRWIVRTGAPWRMISHDLPPWSAVYQQTQRWVRAEVFETMVHDLPILHCHNDERDEEENAPWLSYLSLFRVSSAVQ